MDIDNPYVGPRTFTLQQKDLFFGREGEARDLRSLVMAERLVLFYAQSGAGKSSLINARLVPQLVDAGFVVLPIGRVGGELPDGISQVDNVFVFNLMLKLDQSEGDSSRFTHLRLADFLANLASEDGQHFYYTPVSAGDDEKDGYTEPPHVLIIDQFEEIFTDQPHRWQDREPFFRQLDEAMAADPLLWVVLSLREDSLAALEPYAHLLAGRMHARSYMQRMDYTAALEAVKNPAELAGRPFAKSVGERLVNNLCQIRVPGQEKTQGGQYVAPVQLQVVCYRLWNKLKGQPGDEITAQDLENAGDVDNALADFYDMAISSVVKERGVSEITLRKWFERKLITEGKTRGTVYQGTHDTGGLPNQVVKALERQFVIRADVRGGGTWYELVHDRFIEPVLQANKIWFKRNETPLQNQAALWEKEGRPDSLLLRYEALENAEKWADSHSSEMEPRERKFLDACQNARDRREDAKRKAKFRLVTALCVVLGLAGIFILLLWQKAEENKKESQRQAIIANALRLATESQFTLEKYPQRSLILAVEAVKISGREGEPRVPEAETALRQALSSVGGQVLSGHEGYVNAVSISPSSRWLVTGSYDKTARLWDLTNLTVKPKIFDKHDAEISAVAISPDSRRVVTASYDKTARLWDLNNLDAEPKILAGHDGAISAVAFSHDNRWLVTGSWDTKACLWDLNNLDAKPKILAGHDGQVSAVAFSHDNSQWMVTGSSDRTACLWDLNNLDAKPKILRGHEHGIVAVALSPDNRWLVTGSSDRTARLWKLNNLDAKPKILRGHEHGIVAVAFSPDNHWLVTGSSDKTARLWDLKNLDAEPKVLAGHDGQISAVAFSHDNRRLVTGSWDMTARLWDLSNLDAKPKILRGHEHGIVAVAFSHDNRRLVTGSWDMTARLWDLNNLDAEPKVIVGHDGQISAVAFSYDNQWMVTGGSGKTACLWDLNNLSAEPKVLVRHDGQISAVAFSHDNRRVITGSSDGTARLWDLNNLSAEPKVLVRHDGQISAVAFSHDNRRVITGSYDMTARLWDLQNLTGEPTRVLRHEKAISAVAFSPNNRWVITGSWDKRARLWDLNNLDAEPKVLRGHEMEISAVAFSPDNRWVITGSYDMTARLWDLNNLAAQPVVLRGHESAIAAVAFSPYNPWLLTASLDSTARLWNLNLDRLIELASRTAGRPLTKTEWEKYMKER